MKGSVAKRGSADVMYHGCIGDVIYSATCLIILEI